MSVSGTIRWLVGGGRRRRLFLLAGAVGLAAAVAGGFWLEEHLERQVKRYEEVVPGVLYRSMQPRGGQWEVLDERGIRTVINLRNGWENPRAFAGEERHAQALGMRLVNLPVSDDLPDVEQFVQFIREVRAGPVPVLVHCEHGRSRTGHMLAGYRVLEQGWSPERALAYIRDTGASLGEGKLPRLRSILEDFSLHREEWLRRIERAPQTTTSDQGE
jgi:protein tyrosine phosphatase (PTP) superfamily phosphohydrolase (DUF442 family)